MIIRGIITETTKQYESKSLTYGPNKDSGGFGDYKTVIIINSEPYYYMTIPMGTDTKKGDEMILSIDTDHEVLAWKNITKNKKSRFNLFHVIFDTYILMTVAFVAFWWYGARDKPEVLRFVYFGGIPFCVGLIIYIFYRGSKKLAAHRELARVE